MLNSTTPLGQMTPHVCDAVSDTCLVAVVRDRLGLSPAADHPYPATLGRRQPAPVASSSGFHGRAPETLAAETSPEALDGLLALTPRGRQVLAARGPDHLDDDARQLLALTSRGRSLMAREARGAGAH